MDTPIRLKQPKALRLTRVEDRVSFVYVDRCAVIQDDNGTALTVSGIKGPQTVYLPTATLAALLLGPGTSITQAAVAALTRTGCAAVFTGSGMVRSYGAFLSPFASTDLLLRQAAIVSDPDRRAQVAKAMFAKRFPDSAPVTAVNAHVTIQQLQAFEGARMKAAYQAAARQHRLTKWRRNNGSDPSMGEPDNVNIALNHANVALYGVVNCAVLLLGLSPGLGVIHTGNRQSFTLDIADLYKTRITIPAAFSCYRDVNPGKAVMERIRNNLRLVRLLPTIVDDIHELLGAPNISTNGEDWDIDEVWLWSGNGQEQLNEGGR